LTDGKKGADLSSYSHFKLWVKYEKPTDDHAIRFQARQIDPKYSSIDDESSLKYNTLEFYPKSATYPLVIPLNRFQVPTWWLTWKELSYEDGEIDFSNIYRLEVVTGNVISPGEHNIIIERIELVGELISSQDLYLILLAIWGSIGFLYLLNKIHLMRGELKISEQRQQELEALSSLLEQKNQELKTRITRNPVTGALNKNGILDLFGRRGPEGLTNLSLMFIHVDHLQQINEQLGYEVGDDIIVKFANILTENTRASDMVARWGEEEFVLVCSEAGLTFANQLAEKLRRLIEEASWPSNSRVTASIGVAEMGRETPLQFIDRVDQALNKAKSMGENCVVAATVTS
jgi:diguanylate cyclase (GGDEF)-like protein